MILYTYITPANDCRQEHILLLYYCFVRCAQVKSGDKINYTCIGVENVVRVVTTALHQL